MKKMHGIVALGAAALLLAGCGSSNDDTPVVVTTDVPASARQEPPRCALCTDRCDAACSAIR